MKNSSNTMSKKPPQITGPITYQDSINIILTEELSVQEEELQPSARLEDLGADEDDLTYIAVRLEDELEIEIPEGAEEKFVTVKDIYDCIRRATTRQKPANRNTNPDSDT